MLLGFYGGGYGVVVQFFVLIQMYECVVWVDVYNFLGWKWMQDRSVVCVVFVYCVFIIIDVEFVVCYVVGDWVFYQKFGNGMVQGIVEDMLMVEFLIGFKMIKVGYVQFVFEVGGLDDVLF